MKSDTRRGPEPSCTLTISYAAGVLRLANRHGGGPAILQPRNQAFQAFRRSGAPTPEIHSWGFLGIFEPPGASWGLLGLPGASWGASWGLRRFSNFSNFSRFSRSGASAIHALQPRNQAILTQPILPRESPSPNQNARYGDSPEMENRQSLQFWDRSILPE